MAKPKREPQWWSDMSGACKYAFVQSQLLSWLLLGIAAYLVFANVGVIAGLLVVLPSLISFVWLSVIMRKRYKRQFPNGRKPPRPD